MRGDHAPDIKLGSVIYGRVSGYPWWPAVVTNCPNTHQWTTGGKFWVYFFNDTAGAWLKASQIRSFDRYNHDLCHEHNSSVTKFRRYQERINKAVSIAESHVTHSSKPIRLKVLPPKRSPVLGEGPRSGISSVESDGNEQREATTVLGNYSKRKPPSIRKRESNVAADPELTKHRFAETENHVEAESAGVSEARPKRKRMRSIRYLEHDELPESRPPKLGGRPASEQRSCIVMPNDIVMEHETVENAGDRPDKLKEAQSGARRRSSRLRQCTEVLKRNGPSEKRSVRKRGRPHSDDSCIEKAGANVKSSAPESSASVGSIRHERGSTKDESALVPQSQEGNRAANTEDERVRESDHLTRRMYVAKLKEVARKSNGEMRWPTGDVATVKGVRSLVGVRSNIAEDVGAPDDGTDSEERPERERKVNTGSLEVAAEDLLEYAMRGYRSDSSDPNDNAAEGLSIAFNNGDIVSSILNRLSNLEKDVNRLNKRASYEQRATLGEDATAAGVKSAVEALAAASAAFARARDYNVALIGRSLEVLWPDGQFPLTGADGDLLRTVAQSLILASCKRRQAEIAKAATEPPPLETKE